MEEGGRDTTIYKSSIPIIIIIITILLLFYMWDLNNDNKLV